MGKLINERPFTPVPQYGDTNYEPPQKGREINAVAIALLETGQRNYLPFSGKWPRNYANQSGDLQPAQSGKVFIVTR